MNANKIGRSKATHGVTASPSNSTPFLSSTSTSTPTPTPMLSPFKTQLKSKVEAEQSTLSPSLSRPNYIINQYSLIFTLKRLIQPLILTPIILFTLTPMITSILISTMNNLSNDNALMSFCISYGIIYYLKYTVVRKYAPSMEKYERTIQSFGWYRLEFLIMLIVSFSIYHVSSRMVSVLDSESDHEDVTSLSWSKYFQRAEFMNLHSIMGWRVLFSFLVLSLLIGSRFIGYFSIVQCSSYPLPNNPYLVIMNNFISYITNFHQVLQPDQQPQRQQHLLRTPVSSSTSSPSVSSRFSTPKRYSKPSIPQTTIQIILHLFGGFLFGLILLQNPITIDVDQSQTACDHDHNLALAMKYLFLVSCALTSAFVFMVTYFNGNIKSSFFTNASSSSSPTVPISSEKRNHHYNHHEIAFNSRTTLPHVSSLVNLITNVVYREFIDKLYLSSVLFYWVISPLLGIGLINIVMKVVNINSKTSTEMNLVLLLLSPLQVEGTCSSDDYSAMRREFILTLLRSYGVTLLMCLYMIGTDIYTRKFLITCGVDIHNLISQSNIIPAQMSQKGYENGGGKAGRENDSIDVRDMEDSNEIAVEDVVTSIILAGLGKDILEDVSTPRLFIGADGHVQSENERKIGGRSIISTTTSWARPINNIEEEEVRRNNNMSERVATSILSGAVCGHTSFSEDLLKFVLLESLGGGGDDEHGVSRSKSSKDTSSLGLSPRHYNVLVQYLASMHQPSQVKGTLSIVRALCAYTGGMGKALSYIAAASPTGRPLPTKRDTFTLPQCAFHSVTNAMKAAARLVVLNMNPSQQTSYELGAIPSRNRFNQLSWFIPVILHTIYNLRCGVLDYAQYLFSFSSLSYNFSQGVQVAELRRETFGNFLAMKHPEMAQVLAICDSWAIKMQQCWIKVDGLDAGVNLDENLKDWLKSLA